MSVPFLSFNPAFSLLISSYMNGEMPSSQGMFGVFIVTMGALTLSYVMSRPQRPSTSVVKPACAEDSTGGFFSASPRDIHESEEERLLQRARKGYNVQHSANGHHAFDVDPPSDYPKRKIRPSKTSSPSAKDAWDASLIMTCVGLFWASASSIEKRGLLASHVEPAHFLLVQKVRACPWAR